MTEQLPDPNASTLSPGLRKSIVFVLSFAGGFLALGTLINAFGVMGEQGVTWAYITRVAPHFLMGAALLWGAFGMVDPSDAKSPGLPGATAAKAPAAPAPAAKPAPATPRGRIATRAKEPGMPPAQAWSLFLILSGALILMVALVFGLAGVSNELGRAAATPPVFGGAVSSRATALDSEVQGLRDELRVARGAHKERLRKRLNKAQQERTEERIEAERARKQRREQQREEQRKQRLVPPAKPLAEEYQIARLLAIIGLPLLLLGLVLRWYRQ